MAHRLRRGVEGQFQRLKVRQRLYDLAMEFGGRVGAILFRETPLQKYLREKAEAESNPVPSVER